MLMAGTKAENPGSGTWAFTQDIPDSWEDCELGTDQSELCGDRRDVVMHWVGSSCFEGDVGYGG